MNRRIGVRYPLLTAFLFVVLSLLINIDVLADDVSADKSENNGWEGFATLLSQMDSLSARNEPTLDALSKGLESVQKLLVEYRGELLLLRNQMTAMNDLIKKQADENATLKANLDAISDSEELMRQLDDAREKGIQLDSALILIDTYEETIADLEADQQELQKRVDDLTKENDDLKSKIK